MAKSGGTTKAVRLYQSALAAYYAGGRASPGQRWAQSRFVLLAERAESALVRAVLAAPDDPAPRIAFGEIQALRASLCLGLSGRALGHAIASAAVTNARAAMWAHHQPALDRLDPDELAVLAAGDPIRTPFVPREMGVGEWLPAQWLRVAARSWFNLAELLARFQVQPREETTPDSLDAEILSGDLPALTIESLIWHCRLPSCTGLTVLREARVLTRDALRLCRALTPVEPDIDWALSRHDEITALLPLDLHDDP